MTSVQLAYEKPNIIAQDITKYMGRSDSRRVKLRRFEVTSSDFRRM